MIELNSLIVPHFFNNNPLTSWDWLAFCFFHKGMRKVLFLLTFVVSLFTLWSCKEKKYEFIGSRYGLLYYQKERTHEEFLNAVVNGTDGDPCMKVAVDLFRRKTGERYEYKVKSQDGNEYKLTEEDFMWPEGYKYYVKHFRHKDYIGTLWVAP